MEVAFAEAWAELTAIIRDECGGLGSRLHRTSDGQYFAYAQWPSEQAWKQQRKATERMVALRTRINECAELIDSPVHGQVVADLLVP